MNATTSRLDQRLRNLREEYRLGEEQLRALEERKRELQNTLQRISGAIQVLEELLREEQKAAPGPDK
jgi:predicted  nucleic acid-binding Zn-ribbon protein